jgi:hypothetical protein
LDVSAYSAAAMGAAANALAEAAVGMISDFHLEAEHDSNPGSDLSSADRLMISQQTRTYE